MNKLTKYWKNISYFKKSLFIYFGIIILIYIYQIIVNYNYMGGVHCGDFGGQDCGIFNFLLIPIILLPIELYSMFDWFILDWWGTLFLPSPVFDFLDIIKLAIPFLIIISIPIVLFIGFKKKEKRIAAIISLLPIIILFTYYVISISGHIWSYYTNIEYRSMLEGRYIKAEEYMKEYYELNPGKMEWGSINFELAE